MMNNLVDNLETLTITGNSSWDDFWSRSVELLQKTEVPQQLIANSRPCEENDFEDYRRTLNKNLWDIKYMLSNAICNVDQSNSQAMKIFQTRLIIIIGEQNEKNVWSTTESVALSEELISEICKQANCLCISQFLSNNDFLNTLLLTLRPKLLEETWKTYPGAVACYKWILKHVEKPILSHHIYDVIPTALIIVDDYIPDNVVIGLECIYEILQHSFMNKVLINTGYAEAIYDVLEKLSHQSEVRYISPLYSAMVSLLATMEGCEDSVNLFGWSKRDTVLLILLDNMESEENLELRHAFMKSLPQLLTNIGCAIVCERMTRILVEYCERYMDLRTLKVTLEAAKTYLLMFHLRVPPQCVSLYTAFIKLHFDLTETPVFDKEIMQNLEQCICLLYKLTPSIGSAILKDRRMDVLMKNNIPLILLGDIKYCD